MKDVTGERYGRLVAQRFVGKKNSRYIWEFRCDCGNTVTIDIAHARNGNTRSCGCLRKEQLAKRNRENAVHGGHLERLYGVWHSMKERCLTTTHKDYVRYGARGITVCQEWRDSYQAFKEWALQSGYDPDAEYGKCTLDRIDNDRGYSPDNCRWVDLKAQAHNRKKGYEINNLKRKTKVCN